MTGPLIGADDLASRLGDPRLSLLDIRWSLADPSGGRARYAEGHIPGAVFVDLEDVTGRPSSRAGFGRHPLPGREAFEEAMREAGVSADDGVVVYDDAGASVAARLWWLLRLHGHDRVMVLDGDINGWTGPVEPGVVTPRRGDFVASEPDRSMWLDRAEVAALPEGHVLIDVRTADRYAGEQEPVDPVAGHIPGARNIPWQDNLGPDGRFLPPESLRELYAGVRPGSVVTYCGSGVTSCHTAIALELAGLGPVRVYAGSWSDWIAAEDPPVATGAG